MIWRLFVIFAGKYGFHLTSEKQLFYKKRRMNSIKKKRVIS